jgi:FkbM family methyltransferase
MTIEVIHEHSVRTDLLTDLPVLDAGCLGFGFMIEMERRGHVVVGMDPNPDAVPPKELYDRNEWNGFTNRALVAPGHPGFSHLRLTHDKQARHLTAAPKEGDPRIECVTIEAFMRELNVTLWDVVKLDIEGAEYDVLQAWPGPIAKQISVEFHEHCAPRGDAGIARVVEHLARWYVPVRHVKDKRHCLPENFWDSLFVLRELT